MANAAPAAVQNVQAERVDGNAVVRWQAVEDAAFYQVYYSGQSILDNSGIYDDFLVTKGPVTTVTLDKEMLTNKAFIAVLAVDANGEESPVFLEESSVVLQGGLFDTETVELQSVEAKSSTATSSEGKNTLVVTTATEQREGAASMFPETETSSATSASIPVWEQPISDGKLHLLLAEATTPTEVLLRFNVFPSIDAAKAETAFSIIDSNGIPLRIRSLYIQAEFIAIETETQVRNEMYQVRLSEPLASTSGGSLDAENRVAVFRGHAEGNAQRATSNTNSSAWESPTVFVQTLQKAKCDTVAIARPPRPTGLRLRATQQADGTHNVRVEWNIDMKNCEQYLQYIVRQSRDRGRTFSPPVAVPSDIAGLDIPGAEPGEYGIGISLINAQGYVSQELFESITLPGTAPVAPTNYYPAATMQPPITTPKQNMEQPVTRAPALASSGASLFFGGLISAGAVWNLRRKKIGKTI